MAQAPSYHDYYYGDEAEQYTFYRLPKALFTDSRYKSLSDSSKILYGLMLDRMSLSIKNGWLDELNRVYIYFTLDDVMEYMNCKHEKAVKLLAELDTEKGAGLIERVKQGQGRPTIIYVRKFFDGSEVLTSEKQKSGLPVLQKSALPKNRSLDFGKTESNKNNINNTEINHTDSNNHYPIQSYPIREESQTPQADLERAEGVREIHEYRDIIKQNIEYGCLCMRYGKERMDEVVELLTDTVCSKRNYIRIASDDYPKETVKNRLLQLNPSHIEYVFECMDNNATKVRNIKKYMLASLYNAPATIDSYYRAEVNHDSYGFVP